VGLFKGFKMSAPEELSQRADKVLSEVLGEAEFSQLKEELHMSS
jgi:hypothetical protein